MSLIFDSLKDYVLYLIHKKISISYKPMSIYWDLFKP